MKKDGKYRYSLQFDDSSEENRQVGEVLEKLGNKKSTVIILAVTEYIKANPEITASKPVIKIQHAQSLCRSDIEGLIRKVVEEKLAEIQIPQDKHLDDAASLVDDADISEMLQNLDLFDL